MKFSAVVEDPNLETAETEILRESRILGLRSSIEETPTVSPDRKKKEYAKCENKIKKKGYRTVGLSVGRMTEATFPASTGVLA